MDDQATSATGALAAGDLERFFELSTELCGIADEAGRILRLNGAWEAILGHPTASLLGSQLLDHVHPDDLPATLAATARLSGGRPLADFTNRYRCADGSYRWLEWRATPDPARGLIYAAARDVTAYREAQAALRDRERWLRQSQRVASLGHYVFELATDRWTSSEVLDDIFGIDAAYLRTAETWAALIHPEDRPGMVAYLQALLVGGTRFDREYRVVRVADGAVRWVHGLGDLSRSTAGRATIMFGTIQDVTERKLAEAARAELGQQLQQSQRMEAVGRLAGGVAHDFNNLLTGIMVNTSLALHEVQPGELVHELLQEVEETADRAATLTRQLLAFGRKQVMETRPLDLDDLVARLERLLVRLLGEDVRLVTRPAAGPGAVAGDAGQLEQVLVNLAVNARDAMPRGGTLTIATEAVLLDEAASRALPGTSPGPHVLLSVSDTGEGMTAEVRARIFEPFYTTKSAGKGTGLGLAMAYGIVQQHHGTITVASEPGRGSTFRLYLPVVAQAPQGAAAPVPGPGEALPGGLEAILLVEDEPVVRTSGQRILERLGYRVVACGSGDEALVAAERERFDLLLTDVVMPGMNGRELAARLLARHPGLAVLYTSGYTADVLGHHGVLDQGLELLAKPYTPGALAHKIRLVLDRRAVLA